MNNALKGVTERFQQEEKFDKEALIDLINIYMSNGKFKKMLGWIKDKTFEGEEFYGIMYPDEYKKDEEGYFGEDKILVYMGNDDLENKDQIVSYDELYSYLKIASEYYIENIPEDKEEVENLLTVIKVRYDVK